MTCAFFGHKDAPASIKPLLENAIRNLIEVEAYDEFLVGNQGKFDAMVYSALHKLRTEYPEIRFYVVLAYMPNGKNVHETYDHTETIYPEGLESVPKRFAIMHRNRWMIKNANAVICYISHSWGGACQAVSLAERKKLKIVNLA